MHDFVFHNGQLVHVSEARLSPGQAGLFNGWGVFTTLLIHRGRPFAFERHWNRLTKDARLVRLPFDFDAGDTLEALRDVMRANRVDEGCARLYFVFNKVGIWQGDEPQPETDLLICTIDVPKHPRSTVLAVQEHGRHAAHPLARAKVTSWLHNVWSLDQAHRSGFDEVILLNERGEVAECTAANVFCLRGESIETPPLSSGCLPGVTREVLLEIGSESVPPIRERVLTLQDLREAEEVFISSTTRGVMPVERIEDHEVPRVHGPVTRRLADAFTAYVDQHCGGGASA